MSANMFAFGPGGAFRGVRTWAFSKAQMYAGSHVVEVVTFDVGSGDFTMLPANARLQTGTPPSGTPNHFVSTWNYLNVVQVYKFAVNWGKILLSTFTGPFDQLQVKGGPTHSYSVVLRIIYDSRVFLMTGDIERGSRGESGQ